MVPAVVAFYIAVDKRDYYVENFWVVSAVLIGARTVFVVVNVYMAIEFLRLFRFFLKMKV